MTGPKVYKNWLSWKNRVGRALWRVVYWTVYRWSPTPCMFWRRFLLRLFGAHVEKGANAYGSARIWAPWNLTMKQYSCLASNVDCYSVDSIYLGEFVTISQYAHLCGAGHDYNDPDFRLVPKPIRIEARAWVAAGAFVSPGVTVGEGAVVGARSVVTRDVAPWNVVAGNPARTVKMRSIRTETR